MTAALPWLPEECLGDPSVTKPVARIVTDWAEAWFAVARWELDGVWEPEAWPREGWTTLRDDGAITLRANGGATLRTAFAMLGIPERPHLTTRDLRLLRRAAGEAFDDLVARLRGDLPSHGGDQECERWRLAIVLDMEPILHLSLSRAAVCSLAQRTYDRVRASAALDRPTAAVLGVSVPIAAELGRASLALDQIAALEAGDVLVLDREVEDPIELLVAGRRSALRCSITDLDGTLGLQVCEQQ